MGIFSTDKNQITIIYNSDTSVGKQTYAYVCNSKKKIRDIDTAKTSLTSTQWVEVAEKLDVKISNLVNRNHPDFKKMYPDDTELDEHDWLKILEHHPELIDFSILIKDEQFYLLNDPTDFLKFIEPDSAGVSRNPAEDKEK